MDVQGILNAVVTHASASGLFDAGVITHEPRSPVANGLLAAVWFAKIKPLPSASGLASTTAVLVFNLRIYTSLNQQPYDAIDPALVQAADQLIGAYSGDLELGGVGTVRNIDLLGQSGVPLEGSPGYVTQDGKLQRVINITIPVIVNDAWGQA